MSLIQLKSLELILEIKNKFLNLNFQILLHISNIYNIYIGGGSHGRNSCQSGQIRKEAAVTMIAGCGALHIFKVIIRDLKLIILMNKKIIEC